MLTLTASGILAIPFLLVGGIVALFLKGRRLGVFKWTSILYLISLLVFLFGVTPYLMAKFLADAGSRPMERHLKETPADWQQSYEEIRFDATDGIRLSGWYVAPHGKNVVIIYSHGLFRSRYELLERAMKLCQQGYGALLYDARHHGKSQASPVSLGFFERHDVLGAIRWLSSKPQTPPAKIVLMGVSMGAAAVLLAAAETTHYSAIIADSPFLNFEKTITHHAWLYLKLPKYPFVPLFLNFFSNRVGFRPSDFDVLAAAPKIRSCPILMIHGGNDRRIPVADGRRIFSALTTTEKEFFVIDGATHGAAYRTAPDVYDGKISEFLAKYLE